ncbi:hypothetical protein E2562_004215 [Oryza meyeriana var. granulata]|uniref:Uncharacterized protein n=1 Tax=Oryza meyeriana var. granulata TaxID=110450 RepID=A0A6G1BSP1_9ORYZ|nr:hypothetical protein E2562_004215 [Oryza meyeriana var. granulata]
MTDEEWRPVQRPVPTRLWPSVPGVTRAWRNRGGQQGTAGCHGPVQHGPQPVADAVLAVTNKAHGQPAAMQGTTFSGGNTTWSAWLQAAGTGVATVGAVLGGA